MSPEAHQPSDECQLVSDFRCKDQGPHSRNFLGKSLILRKISYLGKIIGKYLAKH